MEDLYNTAVTHSNMYGFERFLALEVHFSHFPPITVLHIAGEDDPFSLSFSLSLSLSL